MKVGLGLMTNRLYKAIGIRVRVMVRVQVRVRFDDQSFIQGYWD